MHPILIKIGPISIPTYGFFVAAGFLLGLALALRRAHQEGINPDVITDLAFYILLGTLLGARIYYVGEHFSYFKTRPWEALYLWKGGLAFYGGFIGALAMALWYVKKHHLPLWPLADLVAPSIAAGEAVGRLGCFSAGCCYGKPCHLPWAVTFTNPRSLAPLGIPLHPTQLYHALANLLIFLVLLWIYPRRKFYGEVFAAYLFLYGLGRFSIEFLRGDPRSYLGPLSLPQWFSMLAMGVSIILFLYLGGKGKGKEE